MKQGRQQISMDLQSKYMRHWYLAEINEQRVLNLVSCLSEKLEFPQTQRVSTRKLQSDKSSTGNQWGRCCWKSLVDAGNNSWGSTLENWLIPYNCCWWEVFQCILMSKSSLRCCRAFSQEQALRWVRKCRCEHMATLLALSGERFLYCLSIKTMILAYRKN